MAQEGVKRYHELPFGDMLKLRPDGKTAFDDRWECPKNPNKSGECEYDTEKDPACDYCLHCGEPAERL